MKLKNLVKNMIIRIKGQTVDITLKNYQHRFSRFAYIDCQCKTEAQFEASITRLYHTVEKGLSFPIYRPGFGKANIENLLLSLEQYAEKGYDESAFFYETALSCLYEYIKKNKEYGDEDQTLLSRVEKLPGKANNCGGTIEVCKTEHPENLNFEQLMLGRHSIRHFAETPVDLKLIEEAINLAQHTPSACNRQGWRTRIVSNKGKIKNILENQNGNRGFGHEFDKLLIITADLCAQQKNREFFQAFIDGGMYAESILNALYFKGIGCVPLSASLTQKQEKKIREIAQIHDSEVFILFIGVGNYPEEIILTTRSERKPALIKEIQ